MSNERFVRDSCCSNLRKKSSEQDEQFENLRSLPSFLFKNRSKFFRQTLQVVRFQSIFQALNHNGNATLEEHTRIGNEKNHNFNIPISRNEVNISEYVSSRNFTQARGGGNKRERLKGKLHQTTGLVLLKMKGVYILQYPLTFVGSFVAPHKFNSGLQRSLSLMHAYRYTL